MKNIYLALFITFIFFIYCKDKISESSQNFNNEDNAKYLEQNIDILENSNGKIVEHELMRIDDSYINKLTVYKIK